MYVIIMKVKVEKEIRVTKSSINSGLKCRYSVIHCHKDSLLKNLDFRAQILKKTKRKLHSNAGSEIEFEKIQSDRFSVEILDPDFFVKFKMTSNEKYSFQISPAWAFIAIPSSLFSVWTP